MTVDRPIEDVFYYPVKIQTGDFSRLSRSLIRLYLNEGQSQCPTVHFRVRLQEYLTVNVTTELITKHTYPSSVTFGVS